MKKMKKKILFTLLFLPLFCAAQIQATLKSDLGPGISSSMYAGGNYGDYKRILREPNLSASLLLGLKRKQSQTSLWIGYKISSHHLSFKSLPSKIMDIRQEAFKKTVIQRYSAGHIPLYIGYNFTKNKSITGLGSKDKKETPSKWSFFAEAGIQFTYVHYLTYDYPYTYPEQTVSQKEGTYKLIVEGLASFGAEYGAISYHFGANANYQLNPKISLSAVLDTNYGIFPLMGGWYGASVYILPNDVERYAITTFSTASYTALKFGAQYKF